MNNPTEFLSKSLVGAGVFLAIPAVLSLLIVAGGVLFVSPFFSGRLPSLSELRELVVPAGWVWFCLLGFFLLWRVVRFVQTAETVPPARWLWPATTSYLLVLAGGCVAWLLHTYRLARAGELRDWHGDAIDSELLLLPAVATLLPVYALLLSSILWARDALKRNG